jgi:diaminohydroxyphosphoribosylaminopyrimidine deaminase/5-amino-6-(5-phosphoribosylamino)uracil reductase
LLLEGGPHLAGAFFDAREIDEMRVFLSRLIVGGKGARHPLEGEGVEMIGEAMRAIDLRCERMADDLLVSARIREW